MNNYELHMKVHTCHDDCQNPICIAVRKAVEEEREACARTVEELIAFNEDDPGSSAAKAIRARGQK